jgi:hypothetical protein
VNSPDTIIATLPGVQLSLSVDLGSGANGLLVNDTGSTTTDGVVLDSSGILMGKNTSQFHISYAASGGGSLTLNVATGSGNDQVNVQGTAANATTLVQTGAGNDAIGVTTAIGKVVSLTVNGGPPTGTPTGDSLSVVDQSMGTIIHNLVSGPGNGVVTIHHTSGPDSTIGYFDIEQVFTSPPAS